MATQPVSLPDRLVLTEDQFENLRQQASAQHIDISEALARAILVSGIVVQRTKDDPETKVLFKRGNQYRELTTNWR